MDSSDSDSKLLNIDEIFEIFDRRLEEHESQLDKLDPEIRRQGQEAAERAHEAWNEERIRIQTERAIEGGFSSWEELLEHELEVDRQNTINYERRMMEKAAQLGITITELYAREYPESERRIPRRRPRCDCDGKLNISMLDYCLFRVIQSTRSVISALELFSPTDRWTHQFLWTFWNFDVVQR